jgi:hypothetical protein
VATSSFKSVIEIVTLIQSSYKKDMKSQQFGITQFTTDLQHCQRVLGELHVVSRPIEQEKGEEWTHEFERAHHFALMDNKNYQVVLQQWLVMFRHLQKEKDILIEAVTPLAYWSPNRELKIVAMDDDTLTTNQDYNFGAMHDCFYGANFGINMLSYALPTTERKVSPVEMEDLWKAWTKYGQWHPPTFVIGSPNTINVSAMNQCAQLLSELEIPGRFESHKHVDQALFLAILDYLWKYHNVSLFLKRWAERVIDTILCSLPHADVYRLCDNLYRHNRSYIDRVHSRL